MIEIAVSLAIIGFALVAIIGVLPIGMNVQKDNREETIINQDSTVLMDAIRSGSQGLDDLTNYVYAITNWATLCKPNGLPQGLPTVYGYTYSGSTVNGTPGNFPITNGFRIVGLLSTPKYVFPSVRGFSGFVSNYVTAYVRSMSGPANEKFPQNNQAMQDLAFSYRMTSEVVPSGTYNVPSVNPGNAMVTNNVNPNLYDLRLVFRWPLRSRGQLGQGGQTFWSLVGGQLLQINDFGQTLYFFQPQNYTNVNTP
jgi:type II secretory pathway pseudopilin PulG